MGEPKKSRKLYLRPSHPWQKQRIEKERELIKMYGLKNMKEVWVSKSILRNIRGTARELQARLRTKETQAVKENEFLMGRLYRLGILPMEANLNDVLTLDEEKILKRRLQTVVYHKGLANTPKQARQLITHGHISIGSSRVTTPGRIVKRNEEELISYSGNSPLSNDMHPARPESMSSMATEVSPSEAPAPADEEGNKGNEQPVNLKEGESNE